MAKTPAYSVTTADDQQVDFRTEGKAADKLAQKLTDETGLVHRVYTPTGKLRLETEVAEPEPVDDVPAVDISEDLAEDAETVEAVEDEPAEDEPVDEPAEEVADEDADEDDSPEAEDAPEVEGEEQDEPADDEQAADEPEGDEEEDEPADEEEDEAAAAFRSSSYASLYIQLKDADPAVKAGATREWERRLEVYRVASRDKDPLKRIVGPAMAAALEAGATEDGRTRAALVKRGLAEKGEGGAFTVTDAGHKALAAAVAAVV